MNRMLPVLIALAMVVSITGPAMAVADTHATDPIETASTAQTADANATNTTVNATAPGLMLAGSIAVQHEELQGEIDHRSFGLQVAAAASNDSKAQVLNRTQAHLETRLEEVETEMERLNDSRANETISNSTYQVRMTAMVTRLSNLERMANSTNQTAGTLPAETLEANGVNVTALEQLRNHARTMTGPETAAMARQIAGNSVGTPMGPPSDRPGGPWMGEANDTRPGADNETRMGGGHGDGMMNGTTTQSPTTNGTGTSALPMTTTERGGESPGMPGGNGSNSAAAGQR